MHNEVKNMAISNVDPTNPVIINASFLQAPIPDNRIRRFGVVSTGDTTIPEIEIFRDITSGEIESILKAAPIASKTGQWLLAFFANNPQGVATVIETGEVGGTPELPDVSANIDILNKFIIDENGACYDYTCPQSFYEDTINIKTLVSAYSGTTQAVYFKFILPLLEDPTTSANFLNLAGLKAFSPKYPSPVTTENVAGAISGIEASAIYNLGQANPLTPLQYKRVVGITPTSFDYSYRMKLVNAGVDYIGKFTGDNVILNGRVGDNESWDYWYAFDVMQNNIKASLENALYNSANSPQAVIPYSQRGIDSLRAVIKGGLMSLQDFGVITQFSQSLDIDAQSPVGLGDITSIPFQTYITANPDKYAQGAYDGFSCIVWIGRFFRQIVFNTTIK